MTFEEIFGLIIGLLALTGLIVLFFIMWNSAEKTETEKRALYKEVAKYYRNRNSQFEGDKE